MITSGEQLREEEAAEGATRGSSGGPEVGGSETRTSTLSKSKLPPGIG
jgi:hypothetical protein